MSLLDPDDRDDDRDCCRVCGARLDFSICTTCGGEGDLVRGELSGPCPDCEGTGLAAHCPNEPRTPDFMASLAARDAEPIPDDAIPF